MAAQNIESEIFLTDILNLDTTTGQFTFCNRKTRLEALRSKQKMAVMFSASSRKTSIPGHRKRVWPFCMGCGGCSHSMRRLLTNRVCTPAHWNSTQCFVFLKGRVTNPINLGSARLVNIKCLPYVKNKCWSQLRPKLSTHNKPNHELEAYMSLTVSNSKTYWSIILYGTFVNQCHVWRYRTKRRLDTSHRTSNTVAITR